jgi:hypothetical protein
LDVSECAVAELDGTELVDAGDAVSLGEAGAGRPGGGGEPWQKWGSSAGSVSMGVESTGVECFSRKTRREGQLEGGLAKGWLPQWVEVRQEALGSGAQQSCHELNGMGILRIA